MGGRRNTDRTPVVQNCTVLCCVWFLGALVLGFQNRSGLVLLGPTSLTHQATVPHPLVASKSYCPDLDEFRSKSLTKCRSVCAIYTISSDERCGPIGKLKTVLANF